MGCEVERMYFDLNSLLEDICKFLSSDKLGKLSPKDQKLAETLISRSKKQLVEIAKIQPTLQCNEDYVIMNNQVNNDDEENSDIYSSVDDANLNPDNPIIEEENPNPYAGLPAKDASQNLKCGIISMKRRFLLGFEVMKRVYASIHKGWLLVYASERDMKPLYTFDLKKFEAKESDQEKSNFELISNLSDKKVYQFIALTHKDMLQWTDQINSNHDKMIMSRKNTGGDISDTTSEIKYSNEDLDSSTDDENRIYEELTTVKRTERKSPESIKSGKNIVTNMFTKKPPLPPSRMSSKKAKVPIKVPPPVVKTLSVSTNNSSDGSLVSYHEITNMPLNSTDLNKSNSNSTKSFDDSFSDDSADSTYETFANVQKFMTTKSPNTFDKESETKGPAPPLPVKKKNSQ